MDTKPSEWVQTVESVRQTIRRRPRPRFVHDTTTSHQQLSTRHSTTECSGCGWDGRGMPFDKSLTSYVLAANLVQKAADYSLCQVYWGVLEHALARAKLPLLPNATIYFQDKSQSFFVSSIPYKSDRRQLVNYRLFTTPLCQFLWTSRLVPRIIQVQRRSLSSPSDRMTYCLVPHYRGLDIVSMNASAPTRNVASRTMAPGYPLVSSISWRFRRKGKETSSYKKGMQ